MIIRQNHRFRESPKILTTKLIGKLINGFGENSKVGLQCKKLFSFLEKTKMGNPEQYS